jgi:hypothetical protein
MIGAAAVTAARIAEALAVYTLAEWMAAGYEPGRQHALGACAFCLIALTAFLLPRAIQLLALSARNAVAATAVVTFAVLYGVLRFDFSHDLALWDFGWVADFMRDSEATLRDGSPAILAAMLAVGLWVRSSIRAADDVDMELMPRSVGIPFAAVTVIMVAGAATDRSGEVARAGRVLRAVPSSRSPSPLALSGATIGEVGPVASRPSSAGTIAATVACVALFGSSSPSSAGDWPPLGAAIEAILTVILTPPA